MTGRRATRYDSTVCSIEKALLDTSFIYIFIFIEGNAVSVINLNYGIFRKNFHEKLSKVVVESAATAYNPVQQEVTARI